MNKLAQNWPYTPGLEYSPPARGTWTIAHTPLLVPDSYEIYVCPESCLRGVSLSAAEFGGLGTRFSLVVIEEADLYLSRMETVFEEGVTRLLEERLAEEGKYPPIVFVFNSCMHQFLDTNMAYIFRHLQERFPEVIFAEGNMNCTMRTTQTHFEAATGRALYKGLLPKGDPLRRAPNMPVQTTTGSNSTSSAPSVNIIGNYFALEDGSTALSGKGSELIELLGQKGIKVNDLCRTKTFEEYQAMADACLNFYTHPFGLAACEDLQKRLGTPFLEVPYCWNLDEIERTESRLLAKVAERVSISDVEVKVRPKEDKELSVRKQGRAQNSGEVDTFSKVASEALTPYRKEAVSALQETAAKLPRWNITIDAAATPRPFGLACLLETYGMRVTTVYAEAVGPLEIDAKKEWERLAAEAGHEATTLPMIDWRMRKVPRGTQASESANALSGTDSTTANDSGNQPECPLLAIGQKAAYYGNTRHFVNLIYQSGLLGFRGIVELCALLWDAAENEKDTEAVLSEKAIGSANKVAEGLSADKADYGTCMCGNKTEAIPAGTLTGNAAIQNSPHRPAPAEQASRFAVNYTSDLSGVCSALYELGGLIVMHDASGCNSTYATHDEPRWYGSESLIFISGLREMDAVLGNDEKYILDIVEAAEETHPKFIAVFGSPIAAMMGTDFKGVARVIEKRTGIPTLPFDTSGFYTYQRGMRQAFQTLAERFVNEPQAEDYRDAAPDCNNGNCPYDVMATRILEEQKKKTSKATLKVNLLGLTPLDFSVVGNVEALLDWCASENLDVVSSWAMNTKGTAHNSYGEPLASLDAISRSAEADVNLVLSSTALDAAKTLQERFGTPYVVGLPMGDEACTRMADLLKEAALTGEAKVLWENTEPRDVPPEQTVPKVSGSQSGYPPTGSECTPSTLLIGEPVFAASLRWKLEQEASTIRILCPLEDSCGLLRGTDILAHDEPTLKAAIRESGHVIADPLYRNLLPQPTSGESPITFTDFPTESYSGRMYRNEIPVFLGRSF